MTLDDVVRVPHPLSDSWPDRRHASYIGGVGSYVDNHIATAGYLRRFTDAAGCLQRIQTGAPLVRESERRKPETVGYRKRFFANRAIAKNVEGQLARHEGLGLEALQRLDRDWPLDSDESFRTRLDIAGLVAIHMVRNPASRVATARIQSEAIAQRRPEYKAMGDAREQELLHHLTSEQFQAEHMLEMIVKTAGMIASTHWTLVEFPAALLATSDHPVSIVPLLTRGVTSAVEPHPIRGLLTTEEFRFPLDPWRMLLFTWANEPDTPETMPGTDDMAGDLNRAVIGQAEKEWFHHPDRRPTRLPVSGLQTDECHPLGRMLLPSYGVQAARQSQRRVETITCVDEMIKSDATNKMRVARVSERH